jgi:hypothetical protein
MSCSVEYEELETPEGRAWKEHCNDTFDEGFIKLGNVKAVVPRNMLNYYDRIKNFRLIDDDVWIVSFPKSGKSIFISYNMLNILL